MNIAVGVRRDRSETAADTSLEHRSLARREIMNLETILPLDDNPFNIMVTRHRMRFFANTNDNLVTKTLDYRHMFFDGSRFAISFQKLHLFAATDKRHSGIVQMYDNVSAVTTTIYFDLVHKQPPCKGPGPFPSKT